jgi:hypothetical protein
MRAPSRVGRQGLFAAAGEIHRIGGRRMRWQHVGDLAGEARRKRRQLEADDRDGVARDRVAAAAVSHDADPRPRSERCART